MAEKRIFNFSAGPGVLPEQVLKTAADQMLNYKGSGMSVMEMSHRSSVYDTIIKDTEKRLRSLMQIPDNYKVLFLQGGASTQFASVALNLMQKGKADYVVTGKLQPDPETGGAEAGCGCGLCLYLQQQYRIWNRVELCSAD